MPSSMVNQQLWIQHETTPGTPVTSAMKRYLGLQLTPGYDVTTEEHMASGYKMPTSSSILNNLGKHTVSTIQDFNVLLPIGACNFGPPVTTKPSGAVNANQHVMTLNAGAADTEVSHTAIWGDASEAVQFPHLLFHSLKLSIQRGKLSLDVDAISDTISTGATLPSTGTTTVPTVPISAIGYDVYMDPSWATLGTTKLLACYEADLDIGDKYIPDSPINSTVGGMAAAVESDKINYTGTLMAAFDANALTMLTDFQARTPLFFRIAVNGPVIDTGTPNINYLAQFDFCAVIKNPAAFQAAPNSPLRVLEFDLQLIPDPTTGNSVVLTLINTLTGL